MLVVVMMSKMWSLSNIWTQLICVLILWHRFLLLPRRHTQHHFCLWNPSAIWFCCPKLLIKGYINGIEHQWPKQIWKDEKNYTVDAKCLPSFNANFRILPKINLDIKCLSNKKSQESERGALCSQSFKKLRRKGLPVDLTTIMVTKLFECWWWLDSEALSPF